MPLRSVLACTFTALSQGIVSGTAAMVAGVGAGLKPAAQPRALAASARTQRVRVTGAGWPPNAPRLSCAARAGGRADMTCGAHQYVGAQMEFCQGRAASASTAS